MKIIKQKQAAEKEKNFPTKPQTLADFKKSLEGTPQFERLKDGKAVDGYWILLQDWTQCTLKCGGGKTYQHWMCVPPKKGGRKCSGKAIRTKPCNNKPCPGQGALFGGVGAAGGLNEVAKPIIKALPFSERPQNNLKCVIKENDVFYLTWDAGVSHSKPANKMPSRIVMNNRTISIFNDDSYANAVFSFDLQKTEISLYEKDTCCFTLSSSNKEFVVCGGFGSRCGSAGNPVFTNEWVTDFNTFKYKCYKELKDKNWKHTMANRALQDALDQAGLDNMAERANLINKNLHQKEMMNWQKKRFLILKILL